MTQHQIDQLDLIQWNEAVNYAVTRLRMQSMVDTTPKPGETIHYNQPKGFDHDPNFISQVN